MNTLVVKAKVKTAAVWMKKQQRRAVPVLLALFGLFAVAVNSAAAAGFQDDPSLSINLDTSSMFNGAQLIIDALGGPYLYIAGLALGASILGAIIAAVSRIRI